MKKTTKLFTCSLPYSCFAKLSSSDVYIPSLNPFMEKKEFLRELILFLHVIWHQN